MTPDKPSALRRSGKSLCFIFGLILLMIAIDSSTRESTLNPFWHITLFVLAGALFASSYAFDRATLSPFCLGAMIQTFVILTIGALLGRIIGILVVDLSGLTHWLLALSEMILITAGLWYQKRLR